METGREEPKSLRCAGGAEALTPRNREGAVLRPGLREALPVSRSCWHLVLPGIQCVCLTNCHISSTFPVKIGLERGLQSCFGLVGSSQMLRANPQDRQPWGDHHRPCHLPGEGIWVSSLLKEKFHFMTLRAESIYISMTSPHCVNMKISQM